MIYFVTGSRSGSEFDGEALTLAFLLICFFGLLFCSFTWASQSQPSFGMGAIGDLRSALRPALLTLFVGATFVFARFSFGYAVGFYLFTTMAGYFWLNTFSTLEYDRAGALVAAMFAMVFFLLPSLMVRRAGICTFHLPRRLYRRAPDVILTLSAIVLGLCALEGFHILGINDASAIRGQATGDRSALMRYAIGNINGALIPFAFAVACCQGRWLLLAALCVVSLLYYPVTLTKLALFTAPFLVMVALLARFCRPRIAVILSLLIPMLVGLAAVADRPWLEMDYSRLLVFGSINFRALAIPSVSLDHYFQFFSEYPVTHFCQVSFLKPWVPCPYAEQLSVVLAKTYGLGNMNASLFATEGMASVGMLWMPLAAFVCGIMIALANMSSFGLPPRFVLMSSALIPLAMMNVPMSTILLSNGLLLLMTLWLVTPRDYLNEFDRA